MESREAEQEYELSPGLKVFMKKKNDLIAILKTIFEFPVLGVILSLFLFVLGYYSEWKGLSSRLSGGSAVHLAHYALYVKLSYISSAIFLLASATFFFWNSIRKKKEISPEAKKCLSDLQELSWREFEEYIWTLFSKLGFSVKGSGGNEPVEAGADLKLKRDGRVSIVRCRKYYLRRVPLSMVSEFYMGLQAEPSLEKGYFITTGFFSHEAKKFAVGKPIELIDGERLMDFVRIADSIDSVRERSSIQNRPGWAGSNCPECGAAMVPRTTDGSVRAVHLFWECSLSPVCKCALRKE